MRPGFQREHITLKPLNAQAFAMQIEHMYDLYDWEINYAQMNMLDSHDMARALWIMGGDKSALKMCILAMMTLPGAPCIYYGDEVGLSSPGDPYCREAFPWHDVACWDLDLLAHYKKAISRRNRHPVLRTGTFRTIYARGDIYACYRNLENKGAIVIYNTARDSTLVKIDLNRTEGVGFAQVWPQDENFNFQIEGRTLNGIIPPRQGLVLVSQ